MSYLDSIPANILDPLVTFTGIKGRIMKVTEDTLSDSLVAKPKKLFSALTFCKYTWCYRK